MRKADDKNFNEKLSTIANNLQDKHNLLIKNKSVCHLKEVYYNYLNYIKRTQNLPTSVVWSNPNLGTFLKHNKDFTPVIPDDISTSNYKECITKLKPEE